MVIGSVAGALTTTVRVLCARVSHLRRLMLLLLLLSSAILGWVARDIHLLGRVLRLLQRAHTAHTLGASRRAARLVQRALVMESLVNWEDTEL